MNKFIQSKLINKKIIFISFIGILIIGIVGLLIFNDTGNSSAKSDSKEKTSSNISNVTKENEKEDSNGVLETENKENDEDTSVISKNGLNISKKSDVSVNSGKKSDDENRNNSQKSTKSNAETNNSAQKNNSNSSNKSNTSNKSNSSSSNGTNSTNNSSGSVSKPSHEHVYNIPVTQKVHHDAVTKTETFTVVDQQAYDEPIYESHQVCKVCGKDFGKGENATVEAINHSVDTGHSYHSASVKVGTKHHDAITHQETKTIIVTPAYDEEKVTGYRCSCGKNK